MLDLLLIIQDEAGVYGKIHPDAPHWYPQEGYMSEEKKGRYSHIPLNNVFIIGC